MLITVHSLPIQINTSIYTVDKFCYMQNLMTRVTKGKLKRQAMILYVLQSHGVNMQVEIISNGDLFDEFYKIWCNKRNYYERIDRPILAPFNKNVSKINSDTILIPFVQYARVTNWSNLSLKEHASLKQNITISATSLICQLLS